jgi:hypothetical protein
VSRRQKVQIALALFFFIFGVVFIRRSVRKLNLDGRGPEGEAMRSLATLRLAVEEYSQVNRRRPAKLEDALMSLPDRPMRELPPLPLKEAKWGYRPVDGHVFIDSPHTDSRGNAWSGY